MAQKARIGIVDFNDEREHVVQGTISECGKVKEKVIRAMEETGEVEIVDPANSFSGLEKMVWRPDLTRKYAQILAEAEIDGVIFHYSVWASPRLTRMAAQILIRQRNKNNQTTPILILTNLAPEQPGMVGGMAAAGGLDQLGIPNLRVWSENISADQAKLDQIVQFARFARERQSVSALADEVIEKLHGQIYGSLGGRSIQIVTAEADPLQWSRIFGVDIQPIGQLDIVRRANQMIVWSEGINSQVVEIKDERISRAFDFLSKYATIKYQGKFTPDKLKYELACYYGTQDLIEDNNLDFFGIKCQTELSEYHVTQCLTHAFSNDSRGPGGEKKKIVPCACEDDKDGVLTQQIMHLLTNQPTMFADFRHLDPKKNLLYLVNCGAHTPWFATRTEDLKANLAKIEIQPQAFYYAASGGTVKFDAAPGPVTGARLGRNNGKYWMNIVPGEFISKPADALTTTPCWPQAYFKFQVPMEQLFREHPCNHIQVVAGNWVAGLVEICEKLGIGYKIQDKKLAYQKVV